jgi:mRNA interferase YafQ
MRMIDRSTAFKRDNKREAKGQHRATLESVIKPILYALATDQPLEAKHRDHDLSGDWAGYRECHIKPDLLLIHRAPRKTIFPKNALIRINCLCKRFRQKLRFFEVPYRKSDPDTLRLARLGSHSELFG